MGGTRLIQGFPADCRYAFENHDKGNLSFILNVVA